jgi:hypothetical protein
MSNKGSAKKSSKSSKDKSSSSKRLSNEEEKVPEYKELPEDSRGVR